MEIPIGIAYCLNSIILWDVRVQACDIHGYQNCILWNYCLFNETYEISCVFEVRMAIGCN